MNLRTLLLASTMTVAAAMAPASAWAGLVGCSLTVPTFSGTYVDTGNLDVAGDFGITCTRDSNGRDDYDLRVILSQSAGETMATPYPDTLLYGIYREFARTSLWTSTAGQDTTISLTGNTRVGAAVLSGYLRIPLAQTAKAAGTYSDTLTATLVLLNNSGFVIQTLASAPVTSQATVAKSCSFGPTMPSYSLTYQAFRTTDLTDTTKNLSLICTKGTGYTLALDAITGIVPVVQLRYGLLFTSTGSGTVSALATSGAATQHGLSLTLPAGQAGSCGTGTCTGNSVRTVTVTY